MGGKKSYATEHAQMGIRVHEFHGLSHFAEFVHPAPGLKLQQLWDGGNRCVPGVACVPTSCMRCTTMRC